MIAVSDQQDSPDEVPVIPPIDDTTYKELCPLIRWMVTAQPWNEMADSNCFTMIDPITGNRQIAVVMGLGGSVFALHLYQEEEGLRWLTRLHLSSAGDPQCSHDAQYDNHYLELEFTDGSHLDDHDWDVMERFGELTTPGTQPPHTPNLSHATLRSIRPGCPPWHPNQVEATRLVDGLRLLRRFYEDHFMELEDVIFLPDEQGRASLPTFRLPEGSDRNDPNAWVLQLEEFQCPPSKQIPDVPADDHFVARLSSFQVKPGTKWEQGAIFSPNPMVDNGKLVYPVVGMIGVTETGRVEGLEVVSSLSDRATVYRRSLMTAATEVGYLPEELVIGSPLTELALIDGAQYTGIRLLSGERDMPLFEQIAQDLLDSPLFRPGDEELPFGSEGLPAEALRELESMLQEAPDIAAGKEEIGRFLGQIMENEAGAAFLQQFADSLGDEGPSPGLQEILASELPPETQQKLSSSDSLDLDRYVMRVDLVGTKPPIWRRLSLPSESTFYDLHLALQAAFDWEDCHLHEFQVRERGRVIAVVGSEELDSNASFHEERTKLKQIFTPNITKAHYVYDFGDNWTHLIKIEKKVPAKTGQTGPECHAGRGIAPLEDCGGIWGYQQLLDGTSELCEEFDEDFLRHQREGKFHPKDLDF